MKKLYIITLLFGLGTYSVSAQGYLGSYGYLSADILHPFVEKPGIRINGGFLFSRFYAVDVQLNLTSRNIDVYSQYQYKYKDGSYDYYANHEYKAGQLKMRGTGARLTFRSFNLASYKAAPIGWYINYSFDYMVLSFKGDITTQTPEGTSITGFIVNSKTRSMESSMPVYSFLITPGKTILLGSSFFLDMGIELGLRFYAGKEAIWKSGQEELYTAQALFSNRINELYLNKNYGGNSHDSAPEIIYEPSIKIGYLF